MKLILTMTAFLFFQTFLNASDTTIVFRKVNYANIFELAKKEKKPIFLYFHYDGCGACKTMEKTAFVDKKVIDFYNSHLICFEVNTLKGEGIETNKIYQVKLHPTYLFLDAKGNITHKIVGTFSPEEFLKQGQDALVSTKTLAYFKQQYDQGKRNPDFLIEYCYKLRNAWELDSLKINEYLKTQTVNDFRKEQNIKFIYEFAIYQGIICTPFESPAYNFISLNKELFTPYFDLEQVNTRLMFIILDTVYKSIERKDKNTFDKAIAALKKYDVGEEYNFKEMDGRTTMWATSKSLVLSAEMAFYKKIGDSNNYDKKLNLYLEKIWNDSDELNSFAWNYYETTDDKTKLKKGVECIIRSIKLSSNYNNNDTYGALLYKLGEYDKALNQAEIAITLAKKNNLDYAGTTDLIEKIKDKQKK